MQKQKLDYPINTNDKIPQKTKKFIHKISKKRKQIYT